MSVLLCTHSSVGGSKRSP
ncbi:hypothetical protein D043_4095A, partial [Vibrio parahaemolyticus EKP-021]